MKMPESVSFIRHGQSWANLARTDKDLRSSLRLVPDNTIRLTPEGVRQAKAAGDWLKDNLPASGVFGYVSPFARTLETALHLDLGIEWKIHPFLIERDWGEFNEKSEEEQMRYLKTHQVNPLYARMPNGQAFIDLCLSNHNFFDTLHREHSESSVIAVCHGERMWVIRHHLERMMDSDFRKLRDSKNLSDKIRNCQIIQYTRKNPETGELSDYHEWMRSLCPWDLKEEDLVWKHFIHKKLSNNDLLAELEKFPPHLTPSHCG